eukprot:4319755-Amphidinium_carterae.1
MRDGVDSNREVVVKCEVQVKRHPLDFHAIQANKGNGVACLRSSLLVTALAPHGWFLSFGCINEGPVLIRCHGVNVCTKPITTVLRVADVLEQHLSGPESAVARLTACSLDAQCVLRDVAMSCPDVRLQSTGREELHPAPTRAELLGRGLLPEPLLGLLGRHAHCVWR